MTRRLLTCLATTLVATIVGGCGLSSQGGPDHVSTHDMTRVGQPAVPIDTAAPTSTSGVTGQVDVYFLRTQRLVAVPRTVEMIDVPGPAIQALLAGPSDDELTDRVTSAIPSDTPFLDVTVVSGIAVVGVPPQFDSLSVPEQILVVAQLTYTLTGIRGIVGLQLANHGSLVDVPNGSGELTFGPVYRADFGSIAPPATTPTTTVTPTGTPTG